MKKNIECQKCQIWDFVAKENGYASAMCEECYSKGFVNFNTIYFPKPQMKSNQDYLDEMCFVDKEASEGKE